MSVPRFLADEDLRYSIVLALRRLDSAVEIATVVEMGLGGSSDDDVLQFASANAWLVVSHDVNTMKAVAERRIRQGAGIAGLFLVPQNRPTKTVADDLLLVWQASELGEWKDRIVYLPL